MSFIWPTLTTTPLVGVIYIVSFFQIHPTPRVTYFPLALYPPTSFSSLRHSPPSSLEGISVVLAGAARAAAELVDDILHVVPARALRATNLLGGRLLPRRALVDVGDRPGAAGEADGRVGLADDAALGLSRALARHCEALGGVRVEANWN